MKNLHIGEIQVSSLTEQAEATLSCEFPKKAELLFKVYDKHGVTCQKEIFSVEKGKEILSIDCTNLKGGKYSVWMEYNGKTFLRSFSLKVEKQEQGIFRKFKNLFQPRQFGRAYY